MQRVIDKQTIIEIVNQYGFFADTRQWHKLAGLMTNPVTADYTSLAGGEPAVINPKDLVAGWEQVLGKLDLTQHIVANHIVTLNGDEAVCDANFQAMHERNNVQWVLGGRYKFELTRTDEAWKIAKVVMTALWQTGDPSIMSGE